MLRVVFACCVVVSSALCVAAEPVAIDVRSSTVDLKIPDWGGVEFRSQEFGREIRLSGGATVVLKDDITTDVEFAWYPEVDHEDTLRITVGTDGASAADDNKPFEACGMLFELGTDGRFRGTLTADGMKPEVVSGPAIPAETYSKGVYHTVRIERRLETDVLMVRVFLNNRPVVLLKTNPANLKGNRIAIGNGPTTKDGDNIIIPVSFIHGLKKI